MPPRCGSQGTHCLPFDSLPEPQHPYLFIAFSFSPQLNIVMHRDAESSTGGYFTKVCSNSSAAFGLKTSH